MKSEDIPQFGVAHDGECRERQSAYAIILNEKKELLVLKVRDMHHLPGGGVEFGEDPETSVIREALEEAGCVVGNLQFLGKANQYLISKKGERLNKIGIFFTAEMVGMEPSKKIEDDHEVVWMTPEAFIRSEARDFQKWAVRKVAGITS